jgi:hypothetical protein
VNEIVSSTIVLLSLALVPWVAAMVAERTVARSDAGSSRDEACTARPGGQEAEMRADW